MSRSLTLQMGIRWEYLGPWAETNGIEGSFDAAQGKIGYHKLPTDVPPQLAPAHHQSGNFFPAGILKKDLNNWGPRVGLVYNVNDKMVARTGFGVYYDNLNLNELQFSRLYRRTTGSTRSSRRATDLSFNADKLFPDLDHIPQFPAPFSMDPDQPQRLHRAVERQRAAIAQAATMSSRWRTPASRSYNEHKRYNINQAQPGTTPIVTRVPYPAFQSAILYSSDAGWAHFQGVSFRVEKRYRHGWSLLGNYQLSSSSDNGSGEIEANDTAFAWDLNADEGPARYDQRHRAAISGGYELPFGPGKRWLSNGGVAAYALGGWQVFGIIRLSSGFPYSVTSTNVCQCGSFVPQRVNFAAGREGDAGNISDGTVTRWFDPTAYLVPALRHARHRWQEHRSRSWIPACGLLAHQAIPDRQGACRIPVGGVQPLQPRELRHARPEHLESDRRHDYVGGRRTQHAIRAAVHLVGGHSRCLRPNRSRMP